MIQLGLATIIAIHVSEISSSLADVNFYVMFHNSYNSDCNINFNWKNFLILIKLMVARGHPVCTVTPKTSTG